MSAPGCPLRVRTTSHLKIFSCTFKTVHVPSRLIIYVVLVTAISLNKLYQIQDNEHKTHAFLSTMYEKFNLLKSPVSKCKTTLVNLIEYLFVSLLEELFSLVCRVVFIPPSFQVLLEDTVGSDLKEKKKSLS